MYYDTLLYDDDLLLHDISQWELLIITEIASAKKTKRDMYTPLCIACYDNIPQLHCVSIDIAEFTGPRRINIAPAAAFGTCIVYYSYSKGSGGVAHQA